MADITHFKIFNVKQHVTKLFSVKNRNSEVMNPHREPQILISKMYQVYVH